MRKALQAEQGKTDMKNQVGGVSNIVNLQSLHPSRRHFW